MKLTDLESVARQNPMEIKFRVVEMLLGSLITLMDAYRAGHAHVVYFTKQVNYWVPRIEQYMFACEDALTGKLRTTRLSVPIHTKDKDRRDVYTTSPWELIEGNKRVFNRLKHDIAMELGDSHVEDISLTRHSSANGKDAAVTFAAAPVTGSIKKKVRRTFP